ncbi:hypothetical protein ANANG_G00052820 [Anguilla anguilla]|uniref:Uncharacterized protein n=1 Tax=Anguilla anguilla TaxID=7936 RepID=A0A9D3MQM6_ANGAN|nr:hypothetical protein ANANG_G00052820 [Anguilla anguilla]
MGKPWLILLIDQADPDQSSKTLRNQHDQVCNGHILWLLIGPLDPLLHSDLKEGGASGSACCSAAEGTEDLTAVSPSIPPVLLQAACMPPDYPASPALSHRCGRVLSLHGPIRREGWRHAGLLPCSAPWCPLCGTA